ncbi:MAG TPA: hypothetical protein VGQ54_06985 [Burkholderiales bacterium]|nr:hypothetical protein [Burkholderiales bacterium]
MTVPLKTLELLLPLTRKTAQVVARIRPGLELHPAFLPRVQFLLLHLMLIEQQLLLAFLQLELADRLRPLQIELRRWRTRILLQTKLQLILTLLLR